MAMEKEISSQSGGESCQVVPQARPMMPADLYEAAVDGNSDFLDRYFGLQSANEVMVAMTCDPSTQEIHENKEVVRYKLESATAFGDTVLHILVANMHNDLALRVFKKDNSLLQARNKKLETPLHHAAKVGNVAIIESFIELYKKSDNEQLPSTVILKGALEETNIDGDTILHLAVQHGHKYVGELLLNFNEELVYKVNKKELSPLHLAILGNHHPMILLLLEFDSSLASTQFSNGMFPIHLAASMGKKKYILLLLNKYPNSAKLKDQHGQNFLHIAAQENKEKVFCIGIIHKCALILEDKDYDGNTPLHIAAQKGNASVMEIIWRSLPRQYVPEENNKGRTPFDISVRQLRDLNKVPIKYRINNYLEMNDRNFTEKWFCDVMRGKIAVDLDREELWQQSQLIGLGVVLITTVSFAAAFTFPGGYNGNTGAPILGRRFMFRTFMLANALAFMRSFICVFRLVTYSDIHLERLRYLRDLFLGSVSCMMVAFGTGSYAMLAPVNIYIAVIIFSLALLLSQPLVILFYMDFPNFFATNFAKFIDFPISTFASWVAKLAKNKRTIFKVLKKSMVIQVLPLMFAFGLAFLK